MAVKNTPEERKLITFLEALDSDQFHINAFVESVRNNGLTEETVGEIRALLTNDDAATPLKEVSEFNNLINRWRLSSQMKNFRRR